MVFLKPALFKIIFVLDPKPTMKRKREELDKYAYGNSENKRQKTDGPVKRGADLSELNQDQRAVLNAVISGRNVFFTGSAGE